METTEQEVRRSQLAAYSNIVIGNNDNILPGCTFNIVIGDWEDEALPHMHNTLLIKCNGFVLKKRISEDEWRMFRKMIDGAEYIQPVTFQ